MAINLEFIIEKALTEAFARAFDQVIKAKVEGVFARAFENGALFGRRMEETIREGFLRFTQEGMVAFALP